MASLTGERQQSKKISGIKLDHIARYSYASKLIKRGDVVLDALCGVGYGSWLMSFCGPSHIVAFDQNSEAIQYAKKYYPSKVTEYICMDYLEADFEPETFDKIVCFEAIEHINEPERLLSMFYPWRKVGRTLILSTPNEEVMPYSSTKFPFHKRHFTKTEIESMVKSAGFSIKSTLYQQRRSMQIDNNVGHFIIIEATK